MTTDNQWLAEIGYPSIAEQEKISAKIVAEEEAIQPDEYKARLWPLSEAERKAGVRLRRDGGGWARRDNTPRVTAVCKKCLKIFEPSRKTAQFCSDRCRVSASRKNQFVGGLK